MKFMVQLLVFNTAFVMGMNNSAFCMGKDFNASWGPYDLKRALGDDYSRAKELAKSLPFAIKDTCYKSFQATDSCATLLKLLIHVEKYPSESKNDFVIDAIKKNTAAIAEMNHLSPQTTNEIVKAVLNKNQLQKCDTVDWDKKYNWEQEVAIKRLYQQFPIYLKEFCWRPVGSTDTDPNCYQLALLFYGLSRQRDKTGAYHENKPLIKETIKKMNLDCFKSGLYTKKQLVADFIKAGKESTVD